MATQLIAIGTGAANSADIVVAAGSPLTVGLKDAAAPRVDAAAVDVLLKDDGGAYWRIDTLTPSRAAIVISGPGTYRLTRRSGSCGAFSA